MIHCFSFLIQSLFSFPLQPFGAFISFVTTEVEWPTVVVSLLPHERVTVYEFPWFWWFQVQTFRTCRHNPTPWRDRYRCRYYCLPVEILLMPRKWILWLSGIFGNRNSVSVVPNKKSNGNLLHCRSIYCFPEMAFTGGCIPNSAKANFIAFCLIVKQTDQAMRHSEEFRGQCKTEWLWQLSSSGRHTRSKVLPIDEIEELAILVDERRSKMRIHLSAATVWVVRSVRIRIKLGKKLPEDLPRPRQRQVSGHDSSHYRNHRPWRIWPAQPGAPPLPSPKIPEFGLACQYLLAT